MVDHDILIMPPWSVYPHELRSLTQHSAAASKNLKLYYIRKIYIYQICAETLPSSLDMSSSEMGRKTVDVCPGVTWVHVSPVFGKNWHLVLRTKRWERASRLLSEKALKPASVMVWGCIRVHGMASSVWRYHWCRGGCWSSGETYATIKVNVVSWENRVYFSRTVLNLILHNSIDKKCVFDWPACSPHLSATENVGASWRGESDNNNNHGLLSSLNLVFSKNGDKFLWKTATIRILNSKWIKKCN